MMNPKTILRQCLLALVLAGTTLGALAGPVNFHVDVNTTALSGTGFLDFTFLGLGSLDPATAKLSNFTGAVGGVNYADGAVTANPDGSFTIGNGPDFWNNFGFDAAFGGMFGFDIAFSTGFLDGFGDGSTFSVYLLDQGYNVLASDTGIANLNLVSGVGIDVSAVSDFATVTAVPEPSDMLMMMTGLGLVGFISRRRKAGAAH